MNIAIIPARGGSKRIPRKNIKLFHGLPIIAYAIKVAKESKVFDEVFVTTDDEEIAEVAKSFGPVNSEMHIFLEMKVRVCWLQISHSLQKFSHLSIRFL